MPQKTLINIQTDQVSDLNLNKPETGMNFQIVETPLGYVAILEDGDALPFYTDVLHYDINDLLVGTPIPKVKDMLSLVVSIVIPNRADALAALRTATISPKYTGVAGAVPLIASDTLKKDTVFYRLLSSSSDPRYVAGQLTAGTYLTTVRDKRYANSGFATVGRYALPIPLPASHVRRYELPTGTVINVGTVAPMFGQAGGGVEIQLPSAQSATLVSASVVSDY
jgi:hypothetical protein